MRFQTSLSSSSSRRNTRTCSSIPASWAPTEARSKAGRQPLRCAAPGFVRQRPWLHSAAAAVAAAKSGRLYDSDDYEWHEFDEQLGLAKTSEVPAASAAGAGGAGKLALLYCRAVCLMSKRDKRVCPVYAVLKYALHA